MKKLSMYVFAVLIAASTIVTSCKKDPVDPGDDPGNPNPNPTEKKCFIKNTKEDGVNYQQYLYTNTNKVDRINTFGDDGTTIDEYSKITYDGSGRATRIDEYEGTTSTGYTTIEYDGNNRPTKARVYAADTSGNISEVAQLTQEYGTGSQVRKSNMYIVDNGVPVLFAYQEYTHTAGNITTEKTYFADEFGQGELVSVTEYTYDTKKNPYAVLNMPILFSGAAMSTNNVAAITYKDEEGNVTSTETYTHQYNGNNFPTTTTVTPSSGSPKTTTLEYNCI